MLTPLGEQLETGIKMPHLLWQPEHFRLQLMMWL
jgi:hypothetical protein